MKPGESRLRATLSRLAQQRAAGASPEPSTPLCLDPSNPFEVAVAEQIRALRDDVDALKTRLDWLFGLIIAAAVTDVLLRLLS